MSSADDLKMQLMSPEEISVLLNSCLNFCCFDDIQRQIYLKAQQKYTVLSVYCFVQDETCFNKTQIKVSMVKRLDAAQRVQTQNKR